jgi:hypothetical protein
MRLASTDERPEATLTCGLAVDRRETRDFF